MQQAMKNDHCLKTGHYWNDVSMLRKCASVKQLCIEDWHRLFIAPMGNMIILMYFTMAIFGCVATGQREKALLQYLFKNPVYDPRTRPAEKGKAVNVTIRFNLYKVVDVMAKDQYIFVYAWMTQMWNDSIIKWNPKHFNNLSTIVVPHKSVWLPDTFLYNQLSERHIGAILNVDPTQKPQPTHSRVIFRYPALYKFTCKIDVKFFPFDVQHCRAIFGSWTYDSSEIDYWPETETIPRETFSNNGEWTLVSATADRQMIHYSCCEYAFALLHIDIVLKRRPLHYLVNLVFPTLVVTAIANLGFFAPSSTTGQREAKVGLGMSTLFALTVFLLMIAEQMPHSSSSVSLISQLFLAILIQTSSGTVLTGMILFVHNRQYHGQAVPPRLRQFFFCYLAPKIRMEKQFYKKASPPNYKLVNRGKDAPQITVSDTTTMSLKHRQNSFRRRLSMARLEKHKLSRVQDLNANTDLPESVINLVTKVEQLRLLALDKYTDRLFFFYPENLEAQEWEFLASILDRLFLIGSSFVVVVFGVAFFICGALATAADI